MAALPSQLPGTYTPDYQSFRDEQARLLREAMMAPPPLTEADMGNQIQYPGQSGGNGYQGMNLPPEIPDGPDSEGQGDNDLGARPTNAPVYSPQLPQYLQPAQQGGDQRMRPDLPSSLSVGSAQPALQPRQKIGDIPGPTDEELANYWNQFNAGGKIAGPVGESMDMAQADGAGPLVYKSKAGDYYFSNPDDNRESFFIRRHPDDPQKLIYQNPHTGEEFVAPDSEFNRQVASEFNAFNPPTPQFVPQTIGGVDYTTYQIDKKNKFGIDPDGGVVKVDPVRGTSKVPVESMASLPLEFRDKVVSAGDDNIARLAPTIRIHGLPPINPAEFDSDILGYGRQVVEQHLGTDEFNHLTQETFDKFYKEPYEAQQKIIDKFLHPVTSSGTPTPPSAGMAATGSGIMGTGVGKLRSGMSIGAGQQEDTRDTIKINDLQTREQLMDAARTAVILNDRSEIRKKPYIPMESADLMNKLMSPDPAVGWTTSQWLEAQKEAVDNGDKKLAEYIRDELNPVDFRTSGNIAASSNDPRDYNSWLEKKGLYVAQLLGEPVPSNPKELYKRTLALTTIGSGKDPQFDMDASSAQGTQSNWNVSKSYSTVPPTAVPVNSIFHSVITGVTNLAPGSTLTDVYQNALANQAETAGQYTDFKNASERVFKDPGLAKSLEDGTRQILQGEMQKKYTNKDLERGDIEKVVGTMVSRLDLLKGKGMPQADYDQKLKAIFTGTSIAGNTTKIQDASERGQAIKEVLKDPANHNGMIKYIADNMAAGNLDDNIWNDGGIGAIHYLAQHPSFSAAVRANIKKNWANIYSKLDPEYIKNMTHPGGSPTALPAATVLRNIEDELTKHYAVLGFMQLCNAASK